MMAISTEWKTDRTAKRERKVRIMDILADWERTTVAVVEDGMAKARTLRGGRAYRGVGSGRGCVVGRFRGLGWRRWKVVGAVNGAVNGEVNPFALKKRRKPPSNKRFMV